MHAEPSPSWRETPSRAPGRTARVPPDPLGAAKTPRLQLRIPPAGGKARRAVRDANRKLPAERKLRIVLGDPPIDWEQVRSREDVGLYLPFRDEFYAIRGG